jgi:hypothetical protein
VAVGIEPGAVVEPDAGQWALLCALLASHPEAISIERLPCLDRCADVEETIARLLIDGLVIRFGDWVKASDAAVRYDQLVRAAAIARGRLTDPPRTVVAGDHHR